MANKLKLTKDALNKEKKSLMRFSRFLPTLKLRKTQLFNEIHKIKMKILAKEQDIDTLLNNVAEWVAVFGENIEIEHFFVINKIKLISKNVAGVDIPDLQEIDFEEKSYDLMKYPFWIDQGLKSLKEAMLLKIELKILHKQHDIIREELDTTIQRINLFEKVKIPETKDHIRKIRIFLGDQQTASVVCGKISKAKLQKKRISRNLRRVA